MNGKRRCHDGIAFTQKVHQRAGAGTEHLVIENGSSFQEASMPFSLIQSTPVKTYDREFEVEAVRLATVRGL
jgi:hypothetical protein